MQFGRLQLQRELIDLRAELSSKTLQLAVLRAGLD